jgi:hypothetical protein
MSAMQHDATVYQDRVTIASLQNGTDRIISSAQVASMRKLLFVRRKSGSIACVTCATDTVGTLMRVCGSVSFDVVGLLRLESALISVKAAIAPK